MTENMRLVNEAGLPLGSPQAEAEPKIPRPLIEQCREHIAMHEREIERDRAVIDFMQRNPGFQEKLDELNRITSAPRR